MTNSFLARSIRPEDYWRSIILYGRNVASYKFALASALLELRPKAGSLLKIEDLALIYGSHITRHIKSSPKQATSKSSQFLDACRTFNEDGNKDKLVSATIKGGFNNVIDAFHIVGSGPIDLQFFIDQRREHAGLRITDEFSKIMETVQYHNLTHEVEARWNLVETAWDLGLAANMLTIQHDPIEGNLIAYTASQRRKSVTSSRSALNGYQRGKCFYCECPISIDKPINADVDHFFPHALKSSNGFEAVDQIWNLVLSCRDCNRGVGGKFDNIPSEKLVGQLHERNEYYIHSHHPLRETLIILTGDTEPERRDYIKTFFGRARQQLAGKLWHP